MTDNSQNTDKYLGSRGADFKGLIVSLLERGRLKPKYTDSLTSGESLKAYGQAFTAASADPVDNYERFEQIGDVTANKFIVWYAYKRFRSLIVPKGSRLWPGFGSITVLRRLLLLLPSDWAFGTSSPPKKMVRRRT